MNLVVLLLLILLLVGGVGTWPAWGWHNYGYGPSGILGTVLVIVLILALLGRI